MDFRLEFSEQASDDLSEIIRYISEELCAPQAAGKFYKAVNEKLSLLKEQPHMFPLYHNGRLLAAGYHAVPVGNFVMFYLVDEDKALVSIARILYGRRDILSIFGAAADT